MLTHIAIQNLTLVKSLSLDFSEGLHVLTGETGAGKSLWVDAIHLALGARADSSVIRTDENSASITLCFDIANNKKAAQWLQQHDFDPKEECLIRRVIHRHRPSRCTLNGIPCPLNWIKELAQHLILIHSQHHQQSLLKKDNQQRYVDQFAHHTTLLQSIQDYYEKWHRIETDIQSLQQKITDRESQLDFFRYQLKELDELSIQDNEWHDLTEEHRKLHHAKSIIQQLNQTIELTVDSEQASAEHYLQQALNRISEIETYDKHISGIRDLLETALIHLREAGCELTEYRSHLDLSPERLQWIENRLTQMHDIARKHHVNPDDLLELQQSLAQKITQLENVDAKIDALRQTQTQIIKNYHEQAQTLSLSRQKAAKKLAPIVEKQCRQLGMEGCQLRIQCEPSKDTITPYGLEHIQFLISTNPGQPYSPLQKIVSGGELSRISLVLQMCVAQKDSMPTLLFDEVDVGIGGKTAHHVGQLLRQLGETTQVLCITHLAQVASQGHSHYKAIKKIQDGTTYTHINPLNAKERIQEIARMLGGKTTSTEAMAHAKALLG